MPNASKDVFLISKPCATRAGLLSYVFKALRALGSLFNIMHIQIKAVGLPAHSRSYLERKSYQVSDREFIAGLCIGVADSISVFDPTLCVATKKAPREIQRMASTCDIGIIERRKSSG